MKNKNFKTQQDPFAKVAQGIIKFVKKCYC